MAVRNRRALTPEEQLEAALVPETEWPYAIPDNWCWVRWGSVGDFVAGSAFKNAYQGFTEYEIPFYKVGSLKYAGNDGYLFDTSNTINSEIRVILKAALIPADSILFAKIGEAIRLNRRRLNDVPCCIDNNMMAFVPHACDRKYAYYWSQDVDMYELTNATTVPAIRKTDLEALPFPLPPLHEQRRIASRIEWLFSKLDDAEAELREVIDSAEHRQTAILHKAFTGELTLQDDDGSQSWPSVPVGTIVSGLKYGTSEKSTYDNDGMPVLRIPNVSSSHVDLNDMKFLSHSDVKPTDLLQEGDILMIRSNGSRDLVGRCAVVPSLDEACTYASFLIRIRPSEKVDSYYLWYFLQSPDAKAQLFTKAKSSSGIHNINSKEIGATVIPLPSLDKQHEIVEALDAFFESENKARSGVIGALDSIRMTRESLLSKALRGELGTNDPAEPSSKELLASIAGNNAGK